MTHIELVRLGELHRRMETLARRRFVVVLSYYCATDYRRGSGIHSNSDDTNSLRVSVVPSVSWLASAHSPTRAMRLARSAWTG